MKNRDNIGENVHSGVFGVADYKYVNRFSEFLTADLKTLNANYINRIQHFW